MHHDPESATQILKVVWPWIKGWFTSHKELKQENESLRAELAEERSGRLAFEHLMSELEPRDCMYWKKDGSGGPYCSLCLEDQHKRISLVPQSEGCYYCRLHEQLFETSERRERILNLTRVRSQRNGARRNRFTGY